MALVPQGVFTASVPMVDETGSVASFGLTFELGTIPDLVTSIPLIVALVPLLEAVSDARARGLTISVPWREGDVTAPVADGRVERTARIDMVTVGGRPASLSVPAIKPGLVDAAGYVNRADPLWAALEAAILGAAVSDSRGEQIGGIRDAREVIRASKTRAPRVRG